MARYQQIIEELILTGGRHLTAEQIYLRLKESHPSLVLATVYNNLNELTRQGRIRRISLEGFPDRYDAPTRHDHLVCTVCGGLTDLPLPDLTEWIEQQTKTPIEGYDLKIHWVCPKCRAAQGTTARHNRRMPARHPPSFSPSG